jgi:histidinol-phosphate aminotransferase
MTKSYVRPVLRDLQGYAPGEQPRDGRVIKLNTNENPYPPSPHVLAAIVAEAGAGLGRYPDPTAIDVRRRAAARYGVRVEQVLVGNGSDELLSLVVRACVDPGTRVAYAVPTYSLYDTLVALQGGVAVRIPYGPDWQFPGALMRAEARLTFVCHPNSPSGTAVSLDAIEAVARQTAGLVVIDEAYVDFADATALELLSRLENAVVLRTFSKSFSLAGMRVGLAIGPPELIAALARVKDSYNVNRVSLVAAAAALDDYAWMERNVRLIRVTRERLTSELRSLGFVVAPSQANFVFARRPGEDLEPLYEDLRRAGILVRHFPSAELRDGLRITVGSDGEVGALMEALRERVVGAAQARR